MVARTLLRLQILIPLFCLIFLPQRLAGQEGQGAEEPPANRVVAVFLSLDDERPRSASAGEEAALLRSGLTTALAANLDGYSFVPAPSVAMEQLDSVTAERGADAWVSASLTARGSLASVVVTVKDLFYDDPGASIRYEIALAGDFRGNTGRYWFPAIEFVRTRLLSPDYETTLFVRGAPGTRLIGLTEPPVVLGPEGEATVLLPFGETVSYTAQAPGYHDVSQELRIHAPEMHLLLSQPRRGRFGYDFFLSGASYPGVGVSFHLLGGWTLLRFDTFTYALGLVPYADVGGDEGRIFASEPVSHLTLWLIQHFQPPDRRFRFYLGPGITTRILHADGTLEPEPIAPYGFTAALGVERMQGDFGAWFFEYTPLFYFVDEPELWDDQFSAGDFGYLRIGENQLDYLMVRIGYRLTPPAWQ